MNTTEKSGIDKVFLIAILMMALLGVLIVFSASSFYGKERTGDALFFFKMHSAKLIVGLIIMFVLMHVDYHRYRPATPVMTLILLVLLVAALQGPEVKGSHRAVVLFGKEFQPSEFMKLMLIFFLSAVFTKGLALRKLTGRLLYMQFFLLLMVTGLVFAGPDLGTSLVLFTVGFGMFYLSGVPWKELNKLILCIAPVIMTGLLLFPYQKRRVLDFLNPLTGRGEASYQIKQSIIGLARGGISGVGYGDGKQKFLFLPEPFSDFAMSSWGEEMGFIGLLFLFGLMLIVLWRGIHIAKSAPDQYGFLLAAGITMMIMVNALINAGVVVSLLPTTGLPFPFLSYGGSSLLMHFMAVGVMLNISRVNAPALQPLVQQKNLHASTKRWEL